MSDPAVPPIELPVELPQAPEPVAPLVSAAPVAVIEAPAAEPAEPETFAEEFEGSLAELVSYLHGKVKALEADVKALLSKV